MKNYIKIETSREVFFEIIKSHMDDLVGDSYHCNESREVFTAYGFNENSIPLVCISTMWAEGETRLSDDNKITKYYLCTSPSDD